MVIKVWSLETKKEVASLKVLQNFVVQVAFSPVGNVLANWGQAIGRDAAEESGSKIQLWDLATNKELRQIQVETMPKQVAFSPDGKQIAVLESISSNPFMLPAPTSLGIWNVASGARLRRLAVRPVGRGAALLA